MAEFPPVETVEDFRRLDDGEVLEGYFDGFHGRPAPGSGHSRSYWHGWRNGSIEAGFALPDHAYRALQEAFLQLGVMVASRESAQHLLPKYKKPPGVERS